MRDISSWSWRSIVGLASGRPESPCGSCDLAVLAVSTYTLKLGAHAMIQIDAHGLLLLLVVVLARIRLCIVLLPRTHPQNRCASISYVWTDSGQNDEIPTTEIESAEEWPGLETTWIMLTLDTYLPVHFALHHRADKLI